MHARLQHERTSRGWTQRQLADLLDLSDRTTVCRWECRNRRPRPRHAVKLEAIFGMSLDTLLADVAEADANASPGPDARPAKSERRTRQEVGREHA